MTYLTKLELFYFIVSGLAIMSVLVSVIVFLIQPEPNCWMQYSTEQQAIENCENHNG
jgi:hypothetical protein